MVSGDKDIEGLEGEKSQKELDEEIKKKKERQVETHLCITMQCTDKLINYHNISGIS